MKRESFKTKNQLNRHVYTYITLFLVVMAILFPVLENLNRIITSRGSEHVKEVQLRATWILDSLSSDPEMAVNSISYEKSYNESFPKSGERASVEIDTDHIGLELVGIVGNKKQVYRFGRQLDGMKQSWIAYNLNEAVQDSDEKELSLLIICGEELTDQDVEVLHAQWNKGVSLLFVQIPEKGGNVNRKLFDLMGIVSTGQRQEWHGMRAGEEMLLGGMMEYAEDPREEISEGKKRFTVTGYPVTLDSQTQVFAHALPKNHDEMEVTEMPPLFWKYTENEEKGKVYVCNGDFMEGEISCAVLPTVLGDLCGTYLYPIVNAQCVMADGMPYGENQERESWKRLYSRDGFGIQRDLLFPELQRCEAIYGVTLTLFSPAIDKIRAGEEKEMKFYQQELKGETAELAGKDGDFYYLDSPDETLSVLPWEPGRTLLDVRTGQLQILYQPDSFKDRGLDLFSMAGAAKWNGYLGFLVDVEELLAYDGQNDILPEYFEQMETVLGYDSTYYSWIEQVTVREAINRIYNYLILKPQYIMGKHFVRIESEYFQDIAWFILRTPHEEIEIDHGTVKKIGEKTYLVEVTEPSAKISWGGERLAGVSDY